MVKGVLRTILTKTLGFIFFLILLAVAEYLTRFIQASVYLSIVDFLIDNIYLSFLIFLLTLVSEILWNLDFPLNVAAPITSAISGFLILEYFYRMWFLIGSITGTEVRLPQGLISLVIFWVIIVFGYVKIFFVKRGGNVRGEKGVTSVTWREIGAEFKLAMYNFARFLRRSSESKPTKIKKKK